MTRDPARAWVGLGANLGDARAAVEAALAALDGIADTRLVKRSSLYRTAPWEASGPDFFNAVAEVETRLTAPELLHALRGLEQAAGRERPYVNAPRTLDLDLLLYGSASVSSAFLTVPHPRMWQRAFVLMPLAEVAPDLVPASALDAVADQAIERRV